MIGIRITPAEAVNLPLSSRCPTLYCAPQPPLAPTLCRRTCRIMLCVCSPHESPAVSNPSTTSVLLFFVFHTHLFLLTLSTFPLYPQPPFTVLFPHHHLFPLSQVHFILLIPLSLCFRNFNLCISAFHLPFFNYFQTVFFCLYSLSLSPHLLLSFLFFFLLLFAF